MVQDTHPLLNSIWSPGIHYGKFLNIRICNDPHSSIPFTTVLQNENNKYNIISQNSNTHQKYKKMAGLSYFKTARTHSSSEQQLTNQYRLIHAILDMSLQ